MKRIRTGILGCLLCQPGTATTGRWYLRVRLGGCLLLAGLSIGLVNPGALSAQDKLEPLERIGIRRGEKEAQFFLKDSQSPEAFDFVEKTFEESVQSMVRVRDLALMERVNGMLYWTYDGFEQPRLHHAAANWTLFVQKMGDFGTNTDPSQSN